MKQGKSSLIFILMALGLLMAIIAVVIVVILALGQRYSQTTNTSTPIRESLSGNQTFSVKRITLKDKKTGCTIEILKNGYVSRVCDDKLQSKKLFSNQTIKDLFNNLDRDKFDNLDLSYFLEEADIEITIETNYGTKTITLNSSGSQPPPEFIENILEETEDLDEDLDDPPPSPPPPPSSTPTPSPGSTPTPPPNSSPTPTLSPTPPGATPIPFSCDMLDSFGVTVSNIYCLNPGEGEPPN